MKKFIGVKLVEAEEYNKVDFTKDSKGWKPIPPTDKELGYTVKYKDGYKSWCPKKTFEEANLLFSGSNTITQEDVDNFIDKIFITKINKKTTFVQVTLKNGFTLEETSSCVDPANYDEATGTEICMGKIKDKIWFLLGFLLQSALYGFNGGE